MSKDTYRDAIYNLKAVVEKTGVSADALRAWERRYGLPDPGRTEASHRVYSQRDIDIIKWLVARQEEGLRIGRAVKLWRNLEGKGHDPLHSMPLPPDTRRQGIASGTTVDELREAWVASTLDFDERRAEHILTRAFAMYPPELVCPRVIADGIAQIGGRWCLGEATPQQEHFASQLAVRRLEALIAATPPPTRRGRILTASPAGEAHTIGLLTVTLLLRRSGWDVVHLGANTPLEQMEQALEATQPDLLILAAQQVTTAASVLDTARLAQDRGVLTGFGGRAFDQEPGIRDQIPGHFLGSSFEAAIREVEQVLTAARPTPRPELVPDVYGEARAHFRDRRKMLEAEAWRTMRAQAVDHRTLHQLNKTVGQSIDAALTFGDMDVASRQLDWLEGLDGCHRPRLERLDSYLRAYHQAAKAHLDERAALVVSWLADRVDGETGASA